MMKNAESLYGRNGAASFVRLWRSTHFVRNKSFTIIPIIAWTILLPKLQPRATLLRRLPWARINCPFRTENQDEFRFVCEELNEKVVLEELTKITFSFPSLLL
jgi:hypothetical protein